MWSFTENDDHWTLVIENKIEYEKKSKHMLSTAF